MIQNLKEKFQEARERLDIVEVAEYCGLQVNRDKFTCCPFHNENTPSMSLQKGTYYHCFGCGAGGDAVKLVSEMFGYTPLEALRMLNRDFGLRLDLDDKPLTRDQKKKFAKERREREQQSKILLEFKAWIDKASRIVSEYIRLLHEWEYRYKPSLNADIDEHYVKAITELPRMEEMFETLLDDDIEAQMQFYNNHRNEVTEIERKLKSAG